MVKTHGKCFLRIYNVRNICVGRSIYVFIHVFICLYTHAKAHVHVYMYTYMFGICTIYGCKEVPISFQECAESIRSPHATSGAARKLKASTEKGLPGCAMNPESTKRRRVGDKQPQR